MPINESIYFTMLYISSFFCFLLKAEKMERFLSFHKPFSIIFSSPGNFITIPMIYWIFIIKSCLYFSLEKKKINNEKRKLFSVQTKRACATKWTKKEFYNLFLWPLNVKYFFVCAPFWKKKVIWSCGQILWYGPFSVWLGFYRDLKIAAWIFYWGIRIK